MNEQPYAYGPDWQAAIDRSSEEWRHYCLAKSLVRRYLTVRLGQGKHAATAFWDSEEQAYGPARQSIWEQLRATARLIYTHEGSEIATHVSRTLHTTRADTEPPAQASTHAVS